MLLRFEQTTLALKMSFCSITIWILPEVEFTLQLWLTSTILPYPSQNLRDLAVSAISDENVNILAQLLLGLLKIEVADCDALTDRGVLALANYCQLLQKVKFWTRCGAISDTSMIPLISNCPLRTIWLGKTNISDATMAALANNVRGLSLLSLRIGDSARITSSAQLRTVSIWSHFPSWVSALATLLWRR